MERKLSLNMMMMRRVKAMALRMMKLLTAMKKKSQARKRRKWFLKRTCLIIQSQVKSKRKSPNSL